jgi:hypothetical protein
MNSSNEEAIYLHKLEYLEIDNTRWFKYDRDDLCVNKSQFVPIIFEPPCTYTTPASFKFIVIQSAHNLTTTSVIHKLLTT